METVPDFEDILRLCQEHEVRYLIIGGLAFTYYAKPRFTKDMDLLIGPSARNVERANRALAEFGSPVLLDPSTPDEIVQIGIDPDRIDLFLKIPGVRFQTAWEKRVRGRYGEQGANFIDLDSLIRAKRQIDDPRHRDDVRFLLKAKKRRKNK